MSLETRLTALENSTKGFRGHCILVTYDDETYTEGNRAMTRTNVNELMAQGWRVTILHVVYDDAGTESKSNQESHDPSEAS